MKNSKLVKIVLIVIMSLAVIIVSKNVFAAEKQSLDPNTLTGSGTSGSSTTSGDNTIPGNTISSGTTGNSISSGTSGNSITPKNTVLTTSNTSNYNNTSLPKTGVEDSMPIVVLAVVLGISAVYAYKKIQDYKNI